MIRIFLNRENELKFLKNEFSKKRSSLIVVYGRRRVGKTELIKKFIGDVEHIYFLTSQEPSNIQLERLVKKVADFFGERIPRITDWIEAIDYIGEKLIQKKIVLVIDEFPYLIDSNSSIPSYFQRLNDEFLKKSKSMVVLSGSSISMMESEVLGHKSPLYGRRTGQIDLAPFDFEKANLFIKKSLEETIIAYSVFGNIPMYLSFFDNSLTLNQNILNNILDKNSFLHKEPELILKQEFREPSKYLSILYAIANGNTRLNEIANKVGVLPNILSKYVEQLMKLRLIKREVPVTERNKKTKKSHYIVGDGLFNFWFKFVEPNLSDVESNPKNFLKNIVVPELPGFVSKTFEEICREYIMKKFNYGTIGRWWHKDIEIDLVAINKSENKILFGECKWKEKVDGIKLLKQLKEKSKAVKWNGSNRNEEYVLFAKTFKKTSDNANFYTLKDLAKLFKK